MNHTVKGSVKGVVNEAEVNVFLKFSCLFYHPTGVDNLISGSSAFSKSILNIWKFSVHVLLKPSLENVEHYFAGVWDECNSGVVWTSFGIAFFVTGVKTDLFQSCGHCWVFQIFWHTECRKLIAFTSQDHLNSEVYAVQAIKSTPLCFKITHSMASLSSLSLFFLRESMSFLKKMSSLKFLDLILFYLFSDFALWLFF